MFITGMCGYTIWQAAGGVVVRDGGIIVGTCTTVKAAVDFCRGKAWTR